MRQDWAQSRLHHPGGHQGPFLLPPSFFFRNRVSYPKPSGQSESTSFASGLPETLVSHCRSCPCPPLYSLDSTHILPFLGGLYSLHPRQCLERKGSSQKRPDELRPNSLEPRRHKCHLLFWSVFVRVTPREFAAPRGFHTDPSESHPCCFFAGWPWMFHFTSVAFIFLICTCGVTIPFLKG